MLCRSCDYSLANLTGPPHRCPECGTTFDPNDSTTFVIEPFRHRRRFWRTVRYIAFVYVAVFAPMLVFGELAGWWGIKGAAIIALVFAAMEVPAVEAVKFLLHLATSDPAKR